MASMLIWLFFGYESCIHTWNMERGCLDEIKNWFNHSMVGWFVEVPNLVGFCIH